MTRFLASAAAVLLLDQLTKLVVRSQMELRQMIDLIGSFARLRYVHNAGAAFGLFQGSRLLFIVISLVSMAVVLYLILSGRYRFRGSRIAFGLVFGGALGNLIDRLWMSEVVDFLDIGIGPHRWPTFNVADIGVTLGVIYLAASFMVTEWEGRQPAGLPASTGEPAAPGDAASPGASQAPRDAEPPLTPGGPS